ncbi:MAG: chemotaxis protein CheW [Candidatus Bathyarchaeota archaeon]|nr:chemotaxis protein CheW [Candidatus Bathyarchaeota archaeon]
MQTVMHTGDIQIVNFTIGEVNYGVPVEQVREVRDMQTVTPVPGAPAFVEGVTNLRGQIITVMDLRKRLGLSLGANAGEKIIIIDLGNNAVGVVVDSVTEVSTIREPDIEKNSVASTLDESIIGVGKQGNHLTIILDIAKTIAKAKDTA